jgi:CHAT domain-containing protein
MAAYFLVMAVVAVLPAAGHAESPAGAAPVPQEIADRQQQVKQADASGDARQRVQARLALMKAAVAVGDLELVLSCAAVALPLAQPLGDPLLTAQVQVRIAQAVVKQGVNLGRALPAVRALVALAGDPDAPEAMRALLPEMLYIQVLALAATGDLEQAELGLADLIKGVPPPGSLDTAGALRVLQLFDAQARLRMARGDSSGGLAACAQAEPILRATQSAPQFRSYHLGFIQLRATLLVSRGDAVGALKLLEVALSQAAPDDPAEKPRRLALLTAQANALRAVGRWDAAIAAQREALETHVALRGRRQLSSQLLQTDLAVMLASAGRAQEAKPLIEQVQQYYREVGGDPLWRAQADSGHARVLAGLGQLKPALEASERAAQAWRQTLGADFADLRGEYLHQADLWIRLGQWPEAARAQAQGVNSQLRQIGAGLAAGSEREKRRLTEQLFPITDRAVQLALRLGGDSEAGQAAATAVLNTRARVLDALSTSARSLGRSVATEDRNLLGELRAARLELAGMLSVPRAPGDSDGLLRWRQTAERLAALEAEVSRRVPQLLGELGPVSVADVQRSLPADGALVEWWTVTAAPLDGAPPADKQGSTSRNHLTAMVLLPSGPPQWFDLGQVDQADQLARIWAERLRDPRRADVHTAGEQLAQRILQPLQAALGGSKRLYLVTDGAISQLPLGALRLPDGRFVGEKWQLCELTSGRDLLRLRKTVPAAGPAAVLADPTFAAELGLAALPGARAEGEQVAALLGSDTALLVGEAATKAALMRMRGPRVLHLATHGWFDPLKGIEQPLAGSGLVLAAAPNAPSKGRMSALDLSGLDLSGTELVALSACETGRGVAMGPEGAYGLRRALVLAGARSALISLWKVDDRSTQALMVAFYQGLAKGASRAEALQRAQLAVLAAQRKLAQGGGPARGAEAMGADTEPAQLLADHPYWWAAFVLMGDAGWTAGGSAAPAPD